MSDAPPPAGSPSSGQPPPIPDHALLHRIGAGSYGEVWLARNVMGAFRAVKIVYRRTFDSDRPYEREFAGLQKFEPISRRHESQLDILHVGRDDARGCFYYVMELADPVVSEPVISRSVPDAKPTPTDSPITDLLITDYSPRTLRSDLARHGRLPVAECVRLGLALATALEHLHSHGLVHRDIKPSNIVFVEGQPKLADIGLVTDADATMSCVGTEGYLPPEGPGAPQADVFGLGKVLYEISTGRDRKEFPDVPKNFADLPDAEKEELREFNAIVLKACQPRAADRYASAAELREALELLQAGKSVRRQQTLEHQLAQLKRWGAWAAAALALVILGLVFWQQRQSFKTGVAQAQAKGATNAINAARRELLLNEVQMARVGARTNGWFDACWEKLREISRLQPGADDARTQAAACLSGLDARLVAAHTNAGAFSLAYSPDGQWLLCAGLTHERTRAQQSAHLWRVSSDQSRRRGNESLIKKDFHPAEDQRLVTSSPTNHYDPPSAHSTFDIRHSEFHALPVSGDAAAAWKPDGTTNGTPVLFQPGDSNHFVLRDALTGRVLRDFPLEGNPSQGNENHPVLALTPDARFAAASVTLADGSDTLSPAEGERAGVRGNAAIPARPANATAERSADGSSASSAETSRGRAVRAPAPQGRFAVWDTVTGQRLFQTNEPASALAFSPDGRALAVGDAEGRVRVFALPEPEPERGFAIRSSPVTDVSLKREERAAAPPERGLAVRIGDELEPASHSSTHSQPGPLRIANPRSAALLAEFPSARVRINCFAFTRDPIVPRAGPLTNAWWLAVGDAGGTIRVFRTHTGEQMSRCRGSEFDVLAIAFSLDGSLLASAGRYNLHFWDPVAETELVRVPGFLGTRPDYIRSATFSPDGGLLAIGGESAWFPSSISIWTAGAKSGLRNLRGLASPVVHLGFSPNQDRVAALTHDWHLGVWDCNNGRLLRVFELPPGETADNTSLVFHPDGVQFAFSAGAEVTLWDSDSGELLRQWSSPLRVGTVRLCFDDQQRLLAVRNETVPDTANQRQWCVRQLAADGTSTRLVEQPDAHAWQTYGFAVTPNGKYFAAWGEVMGVPKGLWRLRLFETATGRELPPRHEHQHGSRTDAVMDASGRYLAFPAGNDGSEIRTIPDWTLVCKWNGTPTIAPDGRTVAVRTATCLRLCLDLTANAQTIPIAVNEPARLTAGPVFSPQGDWVAWGHAHGLVCLADWRTIQSRLDQLEAPAVTRASSAE